MRLLTLISSLCLLVCRVAVGNVAATQPIPLIHVHAHNDYEHQRPFFDAIERGFCSVEADIHLVDGKLLVAHDRKQVKPDRTLQSLYLDPFQARVKINGGRVFRGGPSVVLLIDVKADANATYAVLKSVLKEYESMLTTWQNNERSEGAVTVIVTGDRHRELIAADNPRLAACDGMIGDLDTNPSPELVPWISEPWAKFFRWSGQGEMPEKEKQTMRTLVAKTHAQHRQLRFWGAPDNMATWTELRAADVDLINTDHLAGAQEFLLKTEKPKP